MPAKEERNQSQRLAEGIHEEMVGKVARRSNASSPPAPPEPVELDWQGTKMYGCPFCGRNNEDKDWTQTHITECPARGGENE